jgi:hypothetical protein
MSDAPNTGYELIRAGLLVSFRILKEEVLDAPADEAEFGMRIRLKFTADEDETDLDEDEVAESTAEWGSFGFIFTLAVLSFIDAKPRGTSEAEYLEGDELKLSDFVERLRFVRGTLCFHADYIRGRRMKTRITVHSSGTVTVETIGRGKSALRWLERMQGKKLMQLVPSE